MAKKVNKTDEQFANVEENLSKAGLFVVKNQKKLLKLLGFTLAIIALFVIFNQYYTIKSFFPPKVYSLETINKSNSDLSQAQFNFDNRNYEGALNGDTVINPIDSSTIINKGFKDIISDYPYTEAANLSNYYAAICQLNLGSRLDSSQYFEDALISLNNLETDNEMISSLVTGLKGDANMELGNTTEAMNFYKSAATDYVNDLTTPYFMMKQAHIHEINKDFSLALEIYNTIKSEYSDSQEGENIDKYISSASNRR
ncbi:MAG: hypothetical protein HN594_02335 [Flavobacteriales bacterium]|nr:hypothetical protein [Flavobacteriales bacterium]MBT7619891.1 hypothetical protein [Flavobacteriales bacterium]